MAEILYGEPVAEALSAGTAAMVERLRARGVTPTLAIVRVGEKAGDVSYERGAVKRCGAVGIDARVFRCRRGRHRANCCLSSLPSTATGVSTAACC